MFEKELLASVVDLAVAYAVLHVVKCQSGHGGTCLIVDCCFSELTL